MVELSALRAAGDYEEIPTGRKELSALRAAGLRSNPDNNTAGITKKQSFEQSEISNPDLTKEYNIFYIIHASIKNHKINHQS